MQSDLEADIPTVSAQHRKEQEALLVNDKKLYAQLKGLIAGEQGLRRRQKPSSTAWYLMLMLGDVLLLVTLLGLLFFFYPLPKMSTSIFGIREMEIIWICPALVSWSLAVNMTQAQNLNYASNRFKGPCSTLFALLLMGIFWMLLSYILFGHEAMVLAKLELFFLGIAIPIYTIWRFMFAEIKHLPRFHSRAVIVGANPAGEVVASELQASRSAGISILGYIDENTDEQSYQGALPILGGGSALRYLAYHGLIDMIIITLEYGKNPGLLKNATDAAQFGVSVLPMSVVYENSTGKIPVEYIGDQWYAALQSEQIISPFYLFWKKALDLTFSVGILLLLCPILPLIALIIYLDSPGSIFYSQERVGFRGKLFHIYKFRTMRPDAEREGRAVWAAASDQRITRIGRIMRSTHFDEIPQLFNILRGDMSLIGPRPERAAFVSELEKAVPFYGHRQAVKPGLTGWAQVKYRYGRSDNDSMIKLQYDLYYIKRQSFMLDLFIILLTVGEVLALRGA